MAKYWTIRPHGVEGGGTSLISCRIAELVDEDGTQHYALFGPSGIWKALADGPLPVEFPMFTSQLNGTNEHNWYIKIEKMDVVTGDMTGTWGHNGYRSSEGSDIPPPADPDTWTAQASSGAGTGGDDEPVAASASASSKP